MNGLLQRRNSWQDGVYGTTCPIPPGKNWTHTLQVKDQISSFFYYPSLSFHKATGGFDGIRILSRPRIQVPFPDPAGDYTILIGDWYNLNHTILRTILENKKLPNPRDIFITWYAHSPNYVFISRRSRRPILLCSGHSQSVLGLPFSSDPFTPKPNPLVIEISGPSGVGKHAVIKKLREVLQGLHFVVTAMPREKRIIADSEEELVNRLVDRKTETIDMFMVRIKTAREEVKHMRNFG